MINYNEIVILFLQLDFLRQFVTGVAYLHSLPEPVLHLDIKLSNGLVDAGLKIKVSYNFLHIRLHEI